MAIFIQALRTWIAAREARLSVRSHDAPCETAGRLTVRRVVSSFLRRSQDPGSALGRKKMRGSRWAPARSVLLSSPFHERGTIQIRDSVPGLHHALLGRLV